MKSKILIIGGAGFIGSHLVEYCLNENLIVHVYDNFSTGRKEFLPSSIDLQIVKGDILNKDSLSSELEKFCPDVVYHLAAIHHIPTCEKYPENALQINIMGTENVITACAEAGIPRLVFSSTGALYDPAITGPLDETCPVKAFDIYSISKLTCEHLLEYSSQKNKLQIFIARLFNNVGTHETNSHLIPAIISQLSGGNRKLILGNLTPRRDYIHVKDAAQALFTLGKVTSAQPFNLFNVGTGVETSIKELISLFEEIIGESISVESSPEYQRKVDRPSQMANINKIKNTLGWRPLRTVRQAVEDVWLESNEYSQIK